MITLNSCKKKTEVDDETQSVVDNAICEQQFMAITPVVSEKGINESGIKRMTSSCETFTVISGDTTDANGDKIYDLGPVTFQINYGTLGCLSPDGLSLRTGQINITTPTKWSATTSSVVTVDLVNYKVNNITYSGQIKITKPNPLTLTTQVINGHCTDGNWNIDYECIKTITQKGPTATPDDIIWISGTSSGKNRLGRTFTTSITNPLVKKTTCKWITSGTLDLTPDGLKTRTVDFGGGTCDDDATFTVNGQTISFKLK